MNSYCNIKKHPLKAPLLKIVLMLSLVTASALADEYATAKELKLMEGFPPPVDKRVNRSNAVNTYPYIRWSFLNMRSVYPSAKIKNADKAVSLTRTIDKGIANVKVKNPQTKEMVELSTYLKHSYTDSLVVIKDDSIVYEKYLNSMNANQPHQMMSVTKSFAGLMALIAVEDGKLKESDAITKYVPELRESSAFKDANVKQVLDMTNSMSFVEDYADPDSDITRYTIVLGFIEPQTGKKYASNIYDYLVTLKTDVAHKHGEVFNYQTPKTDVVNWITNRATKKSFQDEMYEKLWSKLGTDGETYILLDKQGTLFAGGGLNATPEDLSRFGMMMINNGKFNNKQVISPDIIKKISDGGDIDAFSNGPISTGVVGNKDWSYRAQWWVRHTKNKESFSAIGIHGQWIYIDIKHKIAIIKQSSQPVADDNFYDEFNINAYDSIISYLTK
jgi:CubicO group peptidase (beta-lactamase class C family)